MYIIVIIYDTVAWVMAIGAGASTDSFATCGAGDLVIHLGEFEGRSTLGLSAGSSGRCPWGLPVWFYKIWLRIKAKKPMDTPTPSATGQSIELVGSTSSSSSTA